MSMCRVFCFVGRGCLPWPLCSLGKTLLAFALLHFLFQGQICLLLQVSLNFRLLHSSLLWWNGYLSLVLVLEGLVGHHRTIQLQCLQHYWLGHRFGLQWYWIVCLGITEIILLFLTAPKYCISDSFFDYEGYSIYSEGFLATVVDIMVIWIKFAHSSPF